jgi:hypothetical protein
MINAEHNGKVKNVNINRWFKTSAAYPIFYGERKEVLCGLWFYEAFFIAAAASATAEEDCPVKTIRFQDISLCTRNLQEVCKKWNHIYLIKYQYSTFIYLELWQQWQHRRCALDDACSYSYHCLTHSWGGCYFILVPESNGHIYLFIFILETLTSVKTHSGSNMYCWRSRTYWRGKYKYEIWQSYGVLHQHLLRGTLL